jgi:hypothetical protein
MPPNADGQVRNMQISQLTLWEHQLSHLRLHHYRQFSEDHHLFSRYRQIQRISNCRTLPRLLPRGHLNIDCKDGTPFTHAHHPTVLCPDPTAYERSILLFDLVDLVYSDLSHSRI